jgi:hypothetical protein
MYSDRRYQLSRVHFSGYSFRSFFLYYFLAFLFWYLFVSLSSFFIPTILSFPFVSSFIFSDRLCGLVVRVPGHRSRGPEFDSRRYQIF